MHRNCGLTTQASEDVKKLPSPVSRGSRGLDRANVYLGMQLGDSSLPCLVIDSGCEVTLIPNPVVEAVGGVVMSPSSQRLWAANGTDIEIVGEVTVPLLLDGRCIDTTALVSPDVEEVIARLRLASGSQLFMGLRSRMALRRWTGCGDAFSKRPLCCRRVSVQDYAALPPRLETDVPARSTLLSTGLSTVTRCVQACTSVVRCCRLRIMTLTYEW